MTDADPVNPMRIFPNCRKQMPEDAIVAGDSGSSANWYARHLRFTAGVRGSFSGTLATMGAAVPYAMAPSGHTLAGRASLSSVTARCR